MGHEPRHRGALWKRLLDGVADQALTLISPRSHGLRALGEMHGRRMLLVLLACAMVVPRAPSTPLLSLSNRAVAPTPVRRSAVPSPAPAKPTTLPEPGSAILQSARPPASGSTFMWTVGAVPLRRGQTLASLVLAGCWSAQQVGGVAVHTRAPHQLLRIHIDRHTGQIAIDNLSRGALPLTITVRFRHKLASAYGSTHLVVYRSGRALPLPFILGGPACPSPPAPHIAPASLSSGARFLYSGAHPRQTGVQPGTIQTVRTAIVRGRVLTRAGAPLDAVRLTVLGHPELGQTLSGTDGSFALAVNGGGVLTLTYTRPGYLPAQRQIQAPWQDYVAVPDVVLIPYDQRVTAIHLVGAAAMQVAQGSLVRDASGLRQATLLFAPGTQAAITLPSGATEALSTLHVRATEFSVGPSGPASMPATLPSDSGYTYAVNFSADEAVAAGASRVSFNKPVIFYVQDFLRFPVGSPVPFGYYDHANGKWIPYPNGRIVQILAVSNGLADLDVDGHGRAATAAQLAALGITDDERRQLTQLYPVGQKLWRIPLTHFSDFDT